MNINERLRKDVACSKHGQAWGRRSWRGDPERAYKFHLQHVKFEDGCYDLGGAYWGSPANLYCAWVDDPEDGEVRMFVRAASHEKAKRLVREAYPNARFYR